MHVNDTTWRHGSVTNPHAPKVSFVTAHLIVSSRTVSMIARPESEPSDHASRA